MNYNDNMLEDERIRSKKKKKKSKFAALFFMTTGCLLVLVLIIYLIGVLLMWMKEDNDNGVWNKASAPAVAPEEEIYTAAELEAAVEAASKQAVEEASASILNDLKKELAGGKTVVETLRPYYPEDLVIVSGGAYHFVPIREDLKKNNYLEENLEFLENNECRYVENGKTVSHKGIDVSSHQGEIDWQQVAEDGVEFAFIRLGFRGYETGKLVEDERFDENITGALGAGIKVGVYLYSQAVNEEEALEEASLVLEKIAPYRVDCPVVFDVEKVSGAKGRMNAISLEERTNLTLLFCQTIENAGYQPMIYHNMEVGAMMLDLETLENYGKWFAYYNKDFYYPYQYEIWQYTDKGKVNGINGNVDLNISFAPLWKE